MTKPEKWLKLEKSFWSAVENNDETTLNKLVAPIFQGINSKGAFTRKEFISEIKKLTITDFSFTNFVANKSHHILVISYQLKTKGKNPFNGLVISIYKDTGKDDKAKYFEMISQSYFPKR